MARTSAARRQAQAAAARVAAYRASHLSPPVDGATLDRAMIVQAARVEYPEAMKNFCRMYRGHQAHLKENGALVLECEADGLDVAKEYVHMLENRADREALFAVPGMTSHGSNPGASFSSAGVDRWDNGMLSPEAYASEVRGETHVLRDRFLAAREEIMKSGVKEALEGMMLKGKRRRRCLSDLEGDWNYDRRYDDQPFEHVAIQPKEFEHVELCFPLGMSSMASSHSIGMFLSRCLALAEVLESAGYRVAITAEDWTYGSVQDTRGATEIARQISPAAKPITDSYQVYTLTRYVLRDACTYGSAGQYAMLASVEFFRRVTFSLLCPQDHYIHALANRATMATHHGFGGANSARALPARPGQVILTAENAARIFSMDEETRKEAFREFLAFTAGHGH